MGPCSGHVGGFGEVGITAGLEGCKQYSFVFRSGTLAFVTAFWVDGYILSAATVVVRLMACGFFRMMSQCERDHGAHVIFDTV